MPGNRGTRCSGGGKREGGGKGCVRGFGLVHDGWFDDLYKNEDVFQPWSKSFM